MELRKEFANREHFRLNASIDFDSPPNLELSSVLGIPGLANRQPDLLYFISVFVSSGMNLNSAFFLPSELVKARDSIVSKPLDLEHDEEKIIGHQYAKAFAYKDGTPFDPDADELDSNILDTQDIDIVTASVLYKTRFPEISKDVEAKKYKVSMECYYEDFDLIVNGVIIPREESVRHGLDAQWNKKIMVTEGDLEIGKFVVGRVLRGIWFFGNGLVENPANPDSVILETANRQVTNNKSASKYILDLTRVDSYMAAKQVDKSLEINTKSVISKENKVEAASYYGGLHSHEWGLGSELSFVDGPHAHVVWKEDLPKDIMDVFFVGDGVHSHSVDTGTGNMSSGAAHKHKFYLVTKDGKWLAYETSDSVEPHNHSFGGIGGTESPYGAYPVSKDDMDPDNFGRSAHDGSHYHTLSLPDGSEIKTALASDLLVKLQQEESSETAEEGVELAGEGNVDGTQLSKPETCLHFKRYVYGYNFAGDNEEIAVPLGFPERLDTPPLPAMPGMGDEPTQGSTITNQNWCNLFDVGCTTLAGEPSSGDCLRHVLNRTTKEVVSNHFQLMLENRRKKGLKSTLLALDEAISNSAG